MQSLLFFLFPCSCFRTLPNEKKGKRGIDFLYLEREKEGKRAQQGAFPVSNSFLSALLDQETRRRERQRETEKAISFKNIEKSNHFLFTF